MILTYRPDLTRAKHDAWLLEQNEEAERIADISKEKDFRREVFSYAVEDFFHGYTLRKDDIPECFTEEEDQRKAYEIYDRCYTLMEKLTDKQMEVIYDMFILKTPLYKVAQQYGRAYNTIKERVMAVIKKAGI